MTYSVKFNLTTKGLTDTFVKEEGGHTILQSARAAAGFLTLAAQLEGFRGVLADVIESVDIECDEGQTRYEGPQFLDFIRE